MYKKVKIIATAYLLMFLLTCIAQTGSEKKLSYEVFQSLEGFKITTNRIEVISDLSFPELLNHKNDDGDWEFISRNISAKTLAGIKGSVYVDVFESPILRLTREFWVASDNSEIATRQKVTNLLKENVNLKSISPLNVSGSESFVFRNQSDAGNWNILYQERLKNGQPATLVPTGNDTISIDPFAVFHANENETPDLLIGYLSQMNHLAEFNLRFSEEENEVLFSSLKSVCEFDGVIVPSGGERTSQWVFIKAGFDPNKLIADFADRVGEYHGVKRPREVAPSVFCTWYFHGREYNEKYFIDDINSLKENHIPFDVFLIDDCWANGDWGYWRGREAFPNGMKNVTDVIKESGYQPGIWTAPYSVDMSSDLAKEHPEWLLKTTADTLIIFGYAVKAWILDPTYPGVTNHLESVFRRLKNDYGFTYFKLDFMRSVFVFDNLKFYDPTVTRLEAFRLGLEAIRRGVGSDAYISVCGGHFGGSLGIANSQRSGSDVVSIWEPKQVFTFRQNILRTWMSRLWHVDPDALMIRKREKTFHDPSIKQSRLALGKLTDAEAKTFALNQYVGGGMVCISEYLKELQPEREEFYKHIIPSINTPSVPLDIYNAFIPSMMLTNVVPKCDGLKSWNTISIMNLEEIDKNVKIKLSGKVIESMNAERFIVSEFFSEKVLGIFAKDETIDLGVLPAHESRLLRIAEWNGLNPVLAATDLHFSGGGVEIKKWKVLSDGSINGEVDTDWAKPVKITVAYPANNEKGFRIRTGIVHPLQKEFYISCD